MQAAEPGQLSPCEPACLQGHPLAALLRKPGAPQHAVAVRGPVGGPQVAAAQVHLEGSAAHWHAGAVLLCRGRWSRPGARAVNGCRPPHSQSRPTTLQAAGSTVQMPLGEAHRRSRQRSRPRSWCLLPGPLLMPRRFRSQRRQRRRQQSWPRRPGWRCCPWPAPPPPPTSTGPAHRAAPCRGPRIRVLGRSQPRRGPDGQREVGGQRRRRRRTGRRPPGRRCRQHQTVATFRGVV